MIYRTFFHGILDLVLNSFLIVIDCKYQAAHKHTISLEKEKMLKHENSMQSLKTFLLI